MSASYRTTNHSLPDINVVWHDKQVSTWDSRSIGEGIMRS
uniref:Uncharacterized protein n=1 Tax=Arundo donax TaxID=35708 RepID=A0A0A9C003_ARUDO